MLKAIFISRHAPSELQNNLMLTAGYEVTFVGDMDAFDTEGVKGLIKSHAPDLVLAVHPATAMTASLLGISTGVFENSMRPTEGGKPTFELKGVLICTPPPHDEEHIMGGFTYTPV